MITNRPDFVISYWIFAWYILYELKIVKYNPKIALIFGLAINLFMLSMMIYFNNSWINIFLFCFINFFIKVLPLIRLQNSQYKWTDFYALVVLFIIYLVWLFLNGINIKERVLNYYDNMKNKKPLGPFMTYMNQLLRNGVN